MVKESGAKIRVRSVKSIEYVWTCSNKQCPKSKADGAIRGTVLNWVVMLAASHILGAARRKEKETKRKELVKVLQVS